MSLFDEATAVLPSGTGTFAWTVPDGWQQGRGAWGGLVVAALVRAIVAAEPDRARTVRTVSVQMMAPATVGAHVITTLPLRRGAAMSTWSASVVDADGGAVATMTAVAGSPRRPVAVVDDAAWGTVTAPAVPDAADVARVPSGFPLPTFTQHLDMRPISGLPLGGGPAESTGWLRLVDPARPSAAVLLALVDAWWPASLLLMAEVPRVATVNFTANLMVDPATLAADQPLLAQGSVTAAADGFVSEHRRLWSADGRLVVDNLQTIVVGS